MAFVVRPEPCSSLIGCLSHREGRFKNMLERFSDVSTEKLSHIFFKWLVPYGVDAFPKGLRKVKNVIFPKISQMVQNFKFILGCIETDVVRGFVQHVSTISDCCKCQAFRARTVTELSCQCDLVLALRANWSRWWNGSSSAADLVQRFFQV